MLFTCLYIFYLYLYLINIQFFDYPDFQLSGLFTDVPMSPGIKSRFDCTSFKVASKGPFTRTRVVCQGWVVQRWVKFNARLRKNYCSNLFSKEKMTDHTKYCSDFPRNILVSPKFTDQIRLFKVGNKTMG